MLFKIILLILVDSLDVRCLNLRDTRRALLTFITSLSGFQTVSLRQINSLDHIQTLQKMLCECFTFPEMMVCNSEN